MKHHSAAGIAFSFLTVGAVHAQTARPTTEAAPGAVAAESSIFSVQGVLRAPAEPTENALVTFDGAQPMQQLRARLKDPAQRTLLRAGHRADLMQSHADVGRVLGIDAATQNSLIELLADLHLEQLDAFHLRTPDPDWVETTTLDDEAARQTRRIEALRELLGEQRLEQYQAFEKTLGERSQVRRFNAWLDAAHKLTPQQTEQMVVLYQAHIARSNDDHGAAQRRFREVFKAMANPDEFQRRSQLMALEGNEDSWRRMPGYNRMLLQGAAAVLTAPQLAVLSQMQSEQANQMQARIEQMRLQAGLDPQIPATPEATSASARTQRAGDVRVSIRLAIDRKAPEIFSQVVRNGSPVTFDTGTGMSVDATPTLYEDGEFDLKLAYHEAGSTGRRVIGETRQMGDVANQRASLDLAFSGGSGSVIVGRKAYVVELDTRVEGI